MKFINFRKNALILLCAFALAAPPQSSHACCGDGAAAAAGATAAGSAVSASIGTAAATIVFWLERINLTISIGFGKLYGEIQKQTASIKTFEEGNIAVQTQAKAMDGSQIVPANGAHRDRAGHATRDRREARLRTTFARSADRCVEGWAVI